MYNINKRSVLLFVYILISGCNFNRSGSNLAVPPKGVPVKKTDLIKENFDSFFRKFQLDSVFQKSRIDFPIKYTISGSEGDADSTTFIPKTGMKYIKLFIVNRTNGIIKKNKISPLEVKIQFQIEDTGYEKDFTFAKKMGKWQLVYVMDNSD